MQNIENDEPYIDQEYFITINSMGEGYKMIKNAFSGFVDCEINKFRLERSEVEVISYIAIVFLCFFTIILL